MAWIPCSEQLPNNDEHDWCLVQIREVDSGYLWIPQVAEYRENLDDWYCEACGGWIKDPVHEGVFEVIAWMPLPEVYKPR